MVTLESDLCSRLRSEYSLQVQPMAMTSKSPQTRLPTVAAVMTLRGRMTVQLSSSVPSLQSTCPSQRQLSNTHLQTGQRELSDETPKTNRRRWRDSHAHGPVAVTVEGPRLTRRTVPLITAVGAV